MLPFSLDILGLEESLMLNGKYSRIISLNDPGYLGPFPKPADGGTICRLHFDDATPSESVWSDDPILATKENLAEILEYSKTISEGDTVLIHCYAGISRSTASACAVLRQHGMEYEDIRTTVQTIRPQSWPNSYILGIYDELLGCNGKLAALLPWSDRPIFDFPPSEDSTKR